MILKSIAKLFIKIYVKRVKSTNFLKLISKLSRYKGLDLNILQSFFWTIYCFSFWLDLSKQSIVQNLNYLQVNKMFIPV